MKAIRLLPVILLLAPLVWAEEADSHQIQGIEIQQMVTATGVSERRPVGESSSFSAEVGTVYCFTRVNGAQDDSRITHVWYRGDKEVARVELPVRSGSWRTWSSKKIPAEWAGDWKVVILSPAGEPIGSTSFSVGG